jgi:Family of unknown function (DUF5764)
MDNNLILAARNEYTEQLQDILCEGIYQEIKNIWSSCNTLTELNVLKSFQLKLCQIPQWNQEIINSKCERTVKSGEYLDKIIEAVFLSNVKILSVVKLNDKRKTINVNVPDTKHFIHRCYIESARAFYQDPYLVDDRENGSNTLSEIQRNIKRSHRVIKESIEKTIRSMIPMEEILNKYLEASDEEDKASTASLEAPVFQEPQPEPQIYGPEPQQFTETPDETFQQTPVQEEELAFDSRPPESFNQPVPDIFTQEPETEKIKVDLRNEDKNFFTDSE